MKQLQHSILSIDLKSFYASVECLDRNLDPFTTPLVVADASRGDGTIVLASSPFIREKYHVKSRCRLYEVDKSIPGLIIALPHMQHYLDVSAYINGIYLDFVSEEDLHIYSIDESFLDVTHYLQRYNDTPRSYAQKILSRIKEETGLTVTCGIGKNLFMAKACMDLEAKHKKDFLAQWDYSDIPEHLWPITPLSRVWGIGSRLERKLNALGFYTVGDIAVSDPSYLKRRFGVIGEEIYYHAHGYDDACIQERYESKEHSLSVGQVLLRDFKAEEIPIVINDMAYELSDRMHTDNVLANKFYLFIGYKDHTGFGKKISFFTPTDSAVKISREMQKAYQEELRTGDELYREISLVACQVFSRMNYQGSLFEEYEEDSDLRMLETTLMDIRQKYGPEKAMPCSATLKSSTFLQRANQIGGHHR